MNRLSHSARLVRLAGQRGVGLVEVLIAMLVLSIGMLGLAGLQMRTLRNNQSSLERGVAVVETHAIADAIRTNRNQSNTFNIAIDAAAPTGTTFAETVVRNWRNNLIASMGEGATGAVACNGDRCTITIRWNDSRGSGDAAALAAHSVSTEVYL